MVSSLSGNKQTKSLILKSENVGLFSSHINRDSKPWSKLNHGFISKL